MADDSARVLSALRSTRSRVTTVNRRLALGGLALLAAFSSAGCADSDGGAEPPDATESGGNRDRSSKKAEIQDPVRDPKARKALRAAFVSLARANTGHYEVTVPLGGDANSHEYARYQLSPVAFHVVREFTGPDGTIRLAYRGLGNDSWIRLESVTSDGQSTPAWRCWVSYEDIANQDILPPELAQAPRGQPPSAVVAASYGIGQRAIAENAIEGTTDLALALGLVSGKILVAAGIDAQADDTVPATFSLDGGTLSGFSVALADLPDAIEAAGGDLPAELSGLASIPGAIETRFSRFGEPVDVDAPPLNERLALTNPDNFEAAMNSCGRP